ncbi:MAG: metal ABC transporter permease, partial [Pseudomonadota bacterium]
VVWKKLAYFGDALAHSALLGVALGLLWYIPIQAAVFVVSLLSALALIMLHKMRGISHDTLLGIISHTLLATGLIIYAEHPRPGLSLQHLLFGDLITVSWGEVTRAFVIGLSFLIVVITFWPSILNAVVTEDIAKVEGSKTSWVQALTLITVALFVASSLPIVGVLLTTALLIIPAATARHWAQHPKQMAVLASVFGTGFVTGGIFCSLLFDTPTGPTIVVIAGIAFLVSTILRFRNVNIP